MTYTVKNIETDYIYGEFDSYRDAVDYANFIEQKKPDLENLICVTDESGEVLA